MVYNIAYAGCKLQSATLVSMYLCCCCAVTVLWLLCCCSSAVAELCWQRLHVKALSSIELFKCYFQTNEFLLLLLVKDVSR